MINQLKKKQPKFRFKDVLKKTQKDLLDIEKPKQQSKENTLEEIKNIMLDLVQYFTNQNRQSDNIFQFRKTLDDVNITDQYEQRSYQQQVRSQLAHQLQKAGQTYTQQQFQEITNAIIQNDITNLPIQFIESLNINNSVVNIQNQYIQKIDGDYEKIKQIENQSMQSQQQLIQQIIQQMKNEEEKEEQEIQEKKVQKPQQQLIEQIVKTEYDQLDKKLKTLKQQQEQNYKNIDKKITNEDGLNRLRQQYNMQTIDLIKNTEKSVRTQILNESGYNEYIEQKRQKEIYEYEQLKKQEYEQLKKQEEELRKKQEEELRKKQEEELIKKQEEKEEKEEQEIQEQEKIKKQQEILIQKNIRSKSQEKQKIKTTTGAQYLNDKQDVIDHLKNKDIKIDFDEITPEDVQKLSDKYQNMFNQVFEFKDDKIVYKSTKYTDITNSNITKLIKQIKEQKGKSKFMKDINSDYDLDTHQLNKSMNKLFEKYNDNYEFLGTYGFQQPQLLDQLQDLKDEIKNGLNVCFIMNTKPITHKGQHWFSVYISKVGIHLFDSQKTDQQQIKFGQQLSKMLNLKLYYNNNIIQKKDSPYCGLFACLFILRMIQSNDFKYASFQYDNQQCIQPQLQMMDNLIQ